MQYRRTVWVSGLITSGRHIFNCIDWSMMCWTCLVYLHSRLLLLYPLRFVRPGIYLFILIERHETIRCFILYVFNNYLIKKFVSNLFKKSIVQHLRLSGDDVIRGSPVPRNLVLTASHVTHRRNHVANLLKVNSCVLLLLRLIILRVACVYKTYWCGS